MHIKATAMNSLQRFLEGNSISPLDIPAVTHITKSFNMRYIMSGNSILAKKCAVFNKDLVYFFAGRPAYKSQSDTSECASWELPTCFIFQFSVLSDISHVYPFDSGAYMSGRMPSYIGSIPIEEFKLHAAAHGAQRLLDAMFDSFLSYYLLRDVIPEAELRSRYGVNPLDPEIMALRRLASDSGFQGIDDRRFAVEIAASNDISLTSKKLLAVVAPSVYFDHISFRNKVEEEWMATPIPYGVFPLDLRSHSSEIYAKVLEFYRAEGMVG